jgi:hypothetical protein
MSWPARSGATPAQETTPKMPDIQAPGRIFYLLEVSFMLHKPAAPVGKDPAAPYKMRLGIWMFFAYSLFYAGFVAINLINPLIMENIVFMGLNLATVYGFSLIIVALLEALVYDALCRRQERRLQETQPDNAEKAQ